MTMKPLVMAVRTVADTRSGEWRDYTFDNDGLGDAGQNGGGHKVWGGAAYL